jgi:hypothetical protein
MNIDDINIDNINDYANIKNTDDIQLTTDKYTYCRRYAQDKLLNEQLQAGYISERHMTGDRTGYQLYFAECLDNYKEPIMDKIRSLRREKKKNENKTVSKELHSIEGKKDDVVSNVDDTTSSTGIFNDTDDEHGFFYHENDSNLAKSGLTSIEKVVFIIAPIICLIIFSILYSNSFEIDKDNKKIWTIYSYIYLTIIISLIIYILIISGFLIYLTFVRN